MNKKLCGFFLILALITGVWAPYASAAGVLASGECGANGANVTWTLDRDGVLTIRGAGAMYDYDGADALPWYDYRDQIKSVTVESGVTTVGNNAFRTCAALETVALPDTLTKIGNVAFYHCETLKQIAIPESVTEIGQNAFGYCALTEIAIPAGVTEIGSGVFYKCAALNAVTVAEGNANYSSADGVLFDKDKKTLLWYPSQKSGTEYAAPTGVTAIGPYAFHSAQYLANVTLPAGVESIGAWAFAYDEALLTISIPVSLQLVGEYAFYECKGLSDENGQYTENGKVTFGGNRQQWSALKMETGNYRLTNARIECEDTKQDVIIASGECGALGSNASWSLNDSGVLAISGSGEMSSYARTSSVPWYGDGETPLRAQIKTVTLTENITNVGDYAFYDCENLTEVHLPSTLTKIGARSFSDCAQLTSVNFSDTALTSIGDYAFNGCSALADADFPDTLRTIGDRAFLRCAALTSVALPVSVTGVGEWAFRWCDKLSALTMDPPGDDASHYSAIGSYSFADCASLSGVSLTDNLTVIGEYAFYNCPKLASVLLPSSVANVGNCAFLSCSSLNGVFVDEGNETYFSANGMLMNNDQTYILYYPSGRNSVACAIPESVTSIADFAFDGATSLADVYYAGNQTQWDEMLKPNIGDYNDPLLNATLHCEGLDPSTLSSDTAIFIESDGQTATIRIYCGRDALGAQAFCALYDKDGCFIGLEEPLTLTPAEDHDLELTLADNVGELRVFAVDGNNLPLCPRSSYKVS